TDYIVGVGIDAAFHGLSEIRSGGKRVIIGPSLSDPGWRGRISRGVYDFLLSAAPEDMRDLGLQRSVIMEITNNREAILESWKKDGGPWNTVRGLGLDGWKKIIQRSISFHSAKIDTVVTVDIHRLIRLPGTLHGKTGLLKVSFPASRIEEFDPLKEAIAFRGSEAKIYVKEAPMFRLGDETFGPFNEQEVTLPLSAAMLLLCKGAAVVVDYHV
ncbi:MAG: hypothetical protein QXR13_02240, partial [Candidatus Bathyarchaeia archaeon]